MKYLIFYIPIAIVLYFLAKQWLAYNKAEKTGSVVYGADYVIQKTQSAIIDSSRGYLAILVGGLLLVFLNLSLIHISEPTRPY